MNTKLVLVGKPGCTATQRALNQVVALAVAVEAQLRRRATAFHVVVVAGVDVRA